MGGVERDDGPVVAIEGGEVVGALCGLRDQLLETLALRSGQGGVGQVGLNSLGLGEYGLGDRGGDDLGLCRLAGVTQWLAPVDLQQRRGSFIDLDFVAEGVRGARADEELHIAPRGLQRAGPEAVDRVALGRRSSVDRAKCGELARVEPGLAVIGDHEEDGGGPADTRDAGGGVVADATDGPPLLEVHGDVDEARTAPADRSLLHPEVAHAVDAIGELVGVTLIGGVAVVGCWRDRVGHVEGKVLAGCLAHDAAGNGEVRGRFGRGPDLQVIDRGGPRRDGLALVLARIGDDPHPEVRRGPGVEACRRSQPLAGLATGNDLPHHLVLELGSQDVHGRAQRSIGLEPCGENVLAVGGALHGGLHGRHVGLLAATVAQ